VQGKTLLAAPIRVNQSWNAVCRMPNCAVYSGCQSVRGTSSESSASSSAVTISCTQISSFFIKLVRAADQDDYVCMVWTTDRINDHIVAITFPFLERMQRVRYILTLLISSSARGPSCSPIIVVAMRAN
jgi:hypothetical protein